MGKVLFSQMFVCSHFGGGGVTPSSWWGVTPSGWWGYLCLVHWDTTIWPIGVPPSAPWEYPIELTEGVSHPSWWGVPLSRSSPRSWWRYPRVRPFSTGWGTPIRTGWGYLPFWLDGGTPIGTEWGYIPHWDWMEVPHPLHLGDRAAERVLSTRTLRAVFLLRSHRRNFLVFMRSLQMYPTDNKSCLWFLS